MTTTSDPTTSAPWSTTPTQRIVVGGTTFTYRELGPRGGLPLVLLHHFTATLDDWDPRVLDGLAARHHVIAFDNRGVGGSGGKVPRTVAAMAADAIQVIHALGHRRIDLLGFSLGGGVAQEVVLAEPQLVRRLILTGTGHRGGGGLTKMPLIVGGAYAKAALRRVDPRHYLFFPRTPAGKTAAEAYIVRLDERPGPEDLAPGATGTAGRDPRVRPRRAARPGHDHAADVRRQRRGRRDGRHEPVPRARGADPGQPPDDLPRLGARRHLPVPRAVRRRDPRVPRRARMSDSSRGRCRCRRR